METKAKNSVNYESKILTIPNVLSFFRICLIPVMIWLYLVEEKSLWTGYVLILSGFTDVVDGFIARTFHMVSNLGKVLDPIADKLTQACMLLCLAVRFPFMPIPFVLMVGKEIYMSLSGMKIIKKTGKVLGADWHGKAATVLLYIMLFFHVFWADIPAGISNLMIAGCAVMILLSWVLYAVRNRKILNER